MSYCIRCGRQTENEDRICDGCRARQPAAESAAGVPVQGGVPPAASETLPFSRAAKLGLIFSLVAAGLLIWVVLLFTIGWDAAEVSTGANDDAGGFILFLSVVFVFGIVSFLPMVASCVLAALGVVFSAVAVARRKRFRGRGEAVAGLIISAAVLLLVIFAAAIG